MKDLNIMEKIGMIVAIVGTLFIVLNALKIGSRFESILAFDQILFWGGIAVWALGHSQKEKAQKDASTNA
jgi:hypothetical protein